MKYLREGIVATRKGGKMKVYLAGPIHDLPDDKCKDWREYAKEKLECETLDPMRRDFRGMEEEAMAEIVEGDKADILEADFILVNYAHKTPSSTGTAMEILFAWEQHKTVIVAIEQDKVSPWLTYHSHAVVKTLDEAIRMINAMAVYEY